MDGMENLAQKDIYKAAKYAKEIIGIPYVILPVATTAMIPIYSIAPTTSLS